MHMSKSTEISILATALIWKILECTVITIINDNITLILLCWIRLQLLVHK